MTKGIGIEFVKEQKGEETRTIARITVSAILDLVCDLWCYEDKFGVGEGYPQADGSLILKHRRSNNPAVHEVTARSQIELTTHLMPSSDRVVSSIMVTGPDENSVRSVRRINACWQFRNSDSFGNRGHFVRDFVNRCFLYTDKGFVQMTDTQRFPDTRRPPEHEVVP